MEKVKYQQMFKLLTDVSILYHVMLMVMLFHIKEIVAIQYTNKLFTIQYML